MSYINEVGLDNLRLLACVKSHFVPASMNKFDNLHNWAPYVCMRLMLSEFSSDDRKEIGNRTHGMVDIVGDVWHLGTEAECEAMVEAANTRAALLLMTEDTTAFRLIGGES